MIFWASGDVFWMPQGDLQRKHRMGASKVAQHCIAHTGLRRAFARGDYTPCNVTVGDHTNWFQVLHAFDYRNFAAVMPSHHLGCFSHGVLWRAASNIGYHDVFVFHRTANCR
jgi:hypothetical protein